MLVTDKFTFAHIPKTGGDFLQRMIRTHFPLREFMREHNVGLLEMRF